MSTKTVTIYQNCKEIKQLKCEAVELSDGCIKFHDTHTKKGGFCQLQYTGEVYYEVSHAERTASANLLNEGVLLSISW